MSTESVAQPTCTPLQRRTFQPGEWPRRKTVDIGRDGVSVSADPLGGIYQISSKIRDPRYALMIAAPWQQFDQKDRQSPLIVREYRKHMERRLESGHPGLGLRLCFQNGPVIITQPNGGQGSQAQFQYQDQRRELFVQTTIQVQHNGHIVQAHQVTNTDSKVCNISVVLDLSFAISRASYGQLTDQGEVAMPKPSNLVMIHTVGDQVPIASIENTSLGARLSAHLFFYNDTRNEYIKVDHRLFPSAGQDENPPSRLLEQPPYEQSIHMAPGETIQLACIFKPEDITLVDGDMPVSPSALTLLSKFLKVNLLSSPRSFGQKVASQKLFIYDGLVEPREVLQRHLLALAGINPKSKLETIESTILFANIKYIIGCCSLPVDTPELHSWAVIPDHIALPLGWPRDNYWQLRLLSQFSSRGSAVLSPTRDENSDEKAWEYETKSLLILAGHLWWLFGIAVVKAEVQDETRYFWRRSYLINGKPKDGTVYQLDTQLYPFLELCDFYTTFEKANHQHRQLVEKLVMTKTFSNVLLDVLSRQDPETGLFMTDETPADDDLRDYPFHLSSNILAWHTMVELANLLINVCVLPRSVTDSGRLLRVADRIFDGINKHLICPCQDGSGAQVFAYALDPSKSEDDPSRHRQYHDGNDIPTLFALEWGFLNASGDKYPTAEGPGLRVIWEKTMTWAFTPDPNWTVDPAKRIRTPGYNNGYAGNGTEPFHGLGSDHSDGAWVLGFFQEWKFAQLLGDREREDRVWVKIQGSMQWDGTFCEAVDVYDGQCTSKTWFSWPGAMIAENLIGTVNDQAWRHAGETGGSGKR